MHGRRQAHFDGHDDLVEKWSGGCRQQCPLVREVGRVEELLGATDAIRKLEAVLESRRQVELVDLVGDVRAQPVGEDRPEDRRGQSAAQVAEELQVARHHAQELLVDRALHRVEVERKGDAEAGADDDERGGHLELSRVDRDLGEEPDTDRHHRGAEGAEVSVLLDPDHQLAAQDAGSDQAEHHRRDQGAGVGGADAEHALEDQGHEDQGPEHPEAGEGADQDRDREGPAPEKRERNDRLRLEVLDDDEDDQQHQAADERHQGLPLRPAVGAGVGERDQDRDQAGDHQEGAGEVDVAPGRLAADVGQEGDKQGHADDADRDVDVEDPAPGPVVGDETAGGGADDRGEAEDAAEDALHPCPGLGIEDVGEDREDGGEEDASEQALGRPEDDQLGHVLAEAAEPAHDHEAGHPDEDEGLAAEEVAELARDRHRHGRGDQVGGGDPGVFVEAVEVGDDARHRGADDGLVERGQEQGQHHTGGHQDQSVAWHRYGGHTLSSSFFVLMFSTNFRQRCLKSFNSASVNPATIVSRAATISFLIVASLALPRGDSSARIARRSSGSGVRSTSPSLSRWSTSPVTFRGLTSSAAARSPRVVEPERLSVQRAPIRPSLRPCFSSQRSIELRKPCEAARIAASASPASVESAW